jgi:hypothetical protein
VRVTPRPPHCQRLDSSPQIAPTSGAAGLASSTIPPCITTPGLLRPYRQPYRQPFRQPYRQSYRQPHRRFDIIGLIIVKELLQYKVADAVPVANVRMRSLPRCAAGQGRLLEGLSQRPLPPAGFILPLNQTKPDQTSPAQPGTKATLPAAPARPPRPRLSADTPMYDLLKLFQTGRSHMVVLTDTLANVHDA